MNGETGDAEDEGGGTMKREGMMNKKDNQRTMRPEGIMMTNDKAPATPQACPSAADIIYNGHDDPQPNTPDRDAPGTKCKTTPYPRTDDKDG